ncbi:hypothetical protein TcYC6_0026090 [Trypanosoma cruzi]|nr:hypothetical protein TcYC6_0010290 [Trypanosoma cruzi]KAF8289730.1 hypothetical protein TcYC6_0026090 [Trypanosoma cruzi]
MSYEKGYPQIVQHSVVEDKDFSTASAIEFPVDRQAAQRLVVVAVAEWLEGYGCHWSLQSCAFCFLLVDTLDIFGNDLRVKHLLGRPWSCRGTRMRGLFQLLECQGWCVGRVPPYCGRTRRRCCSLGRATLIRCSSFYEELPSTHQVEVPEAGAGRSPR